MILSRSDWVLFPLGRLYAAPFVSQYLLYRLKDIDCSLLFRVDEGAVSTIQIEEEAHTIRTQVMTGNPKAVFLRRSLSAETPLLDFKLIAPIKISLGSSQQQYRVDGLTISLEPLRLPSSRGFLLQDSKASSAIHEIEQTEYAAWMPDSLCSAPEFAKNPLRGVFFDCYRVSVLNEQDGKCYDLDSARDWSLSALGMVIDWKPVYEGILQKRANAER